MSMLSAEEAAERVLRVLSRRASSIA